MRSASQLAKTAESSVAPIAAVGYPSSHTNIPANTNRVATYSATYTVTWMPSRSVSLPEATPSIIANAAARHAGTPKPPLWNSLSGWGAVGRPYSWGHADRKSTRLNSSHRCISYAVICLKKNDRLSANRPDAVGGSETGLPCGDVLLHRIDQLRVFRGEIRILEAELHFGFVFEKYGAHPDLRSSRTRARPS